MPLAGYCALGCIDNGTMSPSGSNPPEQFGFTNMSGDTQGFSFSPIILIPDAAPLPGSIAISGTYGLIATRIGGVWTSGNLDAFLGISAFPINAIGSFLSYAQVFWSSATGFAVFQATATGSMINLYAQPHMSPMLDLVSPLPLGSYIVAFFNEGPPVMNLTWTATMNSGSIFVGVQPPQPPAAATAIAMVLA